MKTFETLVIAGFVGVLPKFGKSEVSFDLNSKSRFLKMVFEKFNAERKNNFGKLSRKKESQVRFFLSNWAAAF